MMSVIYGESIPIVKAVRKHVCLSTSIQISVRDLLFLLIFLLICYLDQRSMYYVRLYLYT